MGSPQLSRKLFNIPAEAQALLSGKAHPQADQVPTLLLSVGEQGLKRYNCWNLTAEQRNVETILNKYKEQLEPQDNFRVCRLRLSKLAQNKEEKLDDIINRCRVIAAKCAFNTPRELDERLLELIIVSTPIPEYKKDLLTKDRNFTLNQALQLGRTYEASRAHIQTLQSLDAPSTIAAVKVQKQQPSSTTCKNCGGNHRRDKLFCPAANVTCHGCGKLGHYWKLCLSTKLGGKSKPASYKQQQQQHPKHGFNFKTPGTPRRDNTRKPAVHNIDFEGDAGRDTPCAEFDELSFDTINHDAIRKNEAVTQLHIKL